MLTAEHDGEYIIFMEGSKRKYVAKYSEDVSQSSEINNSFSSYFLNQDKINTTCITINSIINPSFPKLSNFLYYFNLEGNPQYTIIEDERNVKMTFKRVSILSKETCITISISKI